MTIFGSATIGAESARLSAAVSAWRLGRRLRRPRVVARVAERVLLQAVAQAAEGHAEELGRLRAHAARPLERLEDEPALDLAEHLVEVAALLREADERRRGLGGGARRPRGGRSPRPIVGPVASATARSMTFSSSRTLPGNA